MVGSSKGQPILVDLEVRVVLGELVFLGNLSVRPLLVAP